MRAKTAREIREDLAYELAKKAAEWIVDQLTGTFNTGWRGTDDLENEIYGWLINHAIFKAPSVAPDSDGGRDQREDLGDG